MMRNFTSLLKEEKEPRSCPVVATCMIDGVIVSWPTSAAFEVDSSNSSSSLSSASTSSSASLSGDHIEQAISELERGMGTEEGRAGLVKLITTCPVLLPLPLESVSHLVRQCTLTRFAAHATITKQGDALHCMMVVLGGSVLELCDVTFYVIPSVSLKGDSRRYFDGSFCSLLPTVAYNDNHQA